MSEIAARSILRFAGLLDQLARGLRHLAEWADGLGDRRAQIADADPLGRFLDHPVHFGGDHLLDPLHRFVGEGRIDRREARSQVAERAVHHRHGPFKGDGVSAGQLHKIYSTWLENQKQTPWPIIRQAGGTSR